MEEEYVLQGIFTHLVQSGFRLGVRDYNDALKALRAGYGLVSRDNLLWLCKTLWARSEEEERQISLLFSRFPFPDFREVIELSGTPAPSEEMLLQSSDEPISYPRDIDDKRSASLKRPDSPVPRFLGSAQDGIGLYEAKVTARSKEPFILTPRSVIALRSLIVIWRRFRTAVRSGPKIELDIEATIDEQCRRGILDEFVLVPARRNQAKLLVLIDVSDSMLPWWDFNRLLVESLRSGQLGQAKVYYFYNVPEENLYQKETLTRPVAVDKAMQEHSGSPLLIISDAGAARGSLSRERVERTEKFISEVWQLWQPVVWVNPMPIERWPRSSAERISRLLNLTMFELNEGSLVTAVDVLRGRRSA